MHRHSLCLSVCVCLSVCLSLSLCYIYRLLAAWLVCQSNSYRVMQPSVSACLPLTVLAGDRLTH